MKDLGGRPRKEFDLDIAKNLVRIQCTANEISDFFGMTDDTLGARLREEGYSGFSDFYKSHGSEGKSSLRRAQWRSGVENLNAAMLIWLGKQYLDQSDKVDSRHTSPDGSMQPQQIIIRAATDSDN